MRSPPEQDRVHHRHPLLQGAVQHRHPRRRIWSDATGTLLDTVNFTSETATGWQQADFDEPGPGHTPNTTYVDLLLRPERRVRVHWQLLHRRRRRERRAQSPGVRRHQRQRTVPVRGRGRVPNQSFNSTNYWVDAVFSNTFADLTAPTISARTPAAGATGVSATSAVSVTFNEAVQPSSVSVVLRDSSNNVVPASVVYNAVTNVATLTPTSLLAYATTYTVTVSGLTDQVGNVMSTPASWSFTTGNAINNASIWGTAVSPAIVTAADNSAVELGLRFRSDISGFITAIRFYKGAGNTGTHVGHLWDATGNQLATVTFANETASGWQNASLSMPVAVTANTTYVVSYYAPNGGYSYDHGYFGGAGVSNSPLFALANGENGGNGLFRYGVGGGFPTGSYQSTNYWVDVVFTNSLGDTTAPTVTGRSPAVSATGVPQDTNVNVTFSEHVDPATVSILVKDSNNNTVAGSFAYNAITHTASFDPAANLVGLRSYTVTVSVRQGRGRQYDGRRHLDLLDEGNLEPIVVVRLQFWDRRRGCRFRSGRRSTSARLHV